MTRSDIRRLRRECPSCGRLVHLNGNGLYRRHFASEPDGRRHLCASSGRPAAGVVPTR